MYKLYVRIMNLLEKYIGIFFEGLLEIIFVTILLGFAITTANAFNGSDIALQASKLVWEYVTAIFLVSFIINFFKGLLSSAESFTSIIGMMAGVILFGNATTNIAPEAIPEMIAYIIAAICGILLHIYLKSRA